jgi:hypothetical protein
MITRVAPTGFGHPHSEVEQRLRQLAQRVLRTDQVGGVRLVQRRVEPAGERVGSKGGVGAALKLTASDVPVSPQAHRGPVLGRPGVAQDDASAGFVSR